MRLRLRVPMYALHRLSVRVVVRDGLVVRVMWVGLMFVLPNRPRIRCVSVWC